MITAVGCKRLFIDGTMEPVKVQVKECTMSNKGLPVHTNIVVHKVLRKGNKSVHIENVQ